MSCKDSLWQDFRNAKTPHNQQKPIMRSSQGIGCSGTGLRYAAPSLLACLLACLRSRCSRKQAKCGHISRADVLSVSVEKQKCAWLSFIICSGHFPSAMVSYSKRRNISLFDKVGRREKKEEGSAWMARPSIEGKEPLMDTNGHE